jgi:hypothetical protein
MACRIVFLLFSSVILYDEAVITVVGFAYRALIMAMHKNQVDIVTTKKTGCLHRLFFKE